VLARLGERDAALQTALEAEAIGRDHLRLMLRSLPERLALNYAAARPRGLNLIFSVSVANPEAVPTALDGLIRSRALVLDEIATRHSAGRGSGDQAEPSWVALNSAHQRLANLLVRGRGQMSWAQYQTVVEAARREREAAEQALAERSAVFREERSRAQIGLEDVRLSLPPETALVSIVRYDHLTFSTQASAAGSESSVRRPPRAIPTYLGFVLRPSGPAVAVSLGSANAIDALITEWRQGIAMEAGAAAGIPVRSSRVTGAELRRLVWNPVARYLQGAVRVFVVPDGALGLVPLAALPAGPRAYLLEAGPVIHYLSAERDVVPAKGTAVAERGLLAIGGPAFDVRTPSGASPAKVAGPRRTEAGPTVRGAPVCGGLDALKFPPLRGSLLEVRDLSSLWQASAAPAGDGEPASLLTGRGAMETTFKEQAHRHRVLHIATHGFFLGDACYTPANATRGVGGLSTARPSDAETAENPLRLSGLAFAGANRRAAAGPDEDDGILTAEEVASLNLSGTEWAVLSACDTGLGQIRAGEGVFGLRRAFSDCRGPHRHHEPVVRGRSGDARLDAGTVRRQAQQGAEHGGRSTRGQPERATGPAGPRPKHASVPLGSVRRCRRLEMTAAVQLPPRQRYPSAP
jgi:hypothetical protein